MANLHSTRSRERLTELLEHRLSCRLRCDCYSCTRRCQAEKVATVQAASSMAVLESMLRQDGLKLAEARVGSAVYA